MINTPNPVETNLFISFYMPMIAFIISVTLGLIKLKEIFTLPFIGVKLRAMIRENKYKEELFDGEQTKILKGIADTLLLEVFVFYKNFFLKDIKVKIKYIGSDLFLDTITIPAVPRTFPEEKKKLNIPMDEDLLYRTILEKDKGYIVFLRYLREDIDDPVEEKKNIEFIDITFSSYFQYFTQVRRINVKSIPIERLRYENKYMIDIK